MLTLAKISCAGDFSEPSRIALEYAAELARRLSAELTLVHVHAPLSGADVLSPSSPGSVNLAAAEQTLDAWRAGAEARVGAPVRSKMLFGDPVAEMARYALESGCELLVVGTHGRAGIPHLVLGSVAEQLIRQSPCPVLVARDRRLLAKAADAEESAHYR